MAEEEVAAMAEDEVAVELSAEAAEEVAEAVVDDIAEVEGALLAGADEEEIAKLEAEMGGVVEGLVAAEEEAAAGAAAAAAAAGVDEPAEDPLAPMDELEASLADVGVEDDDHLAGIDVEEHLKDSVSGSWLLKRLLDRDEDENAPPGKKRKHEDPVKDEKVKALLTKWNMLTDLGVKHVLDQSSIEDLDDLSKSGYVPDRFNPMKSATELFGRYIQEMREKSMPGGAACDVVNAFKHRWKLGLAADRPLRILTHKELRYVFNNYDGTKELTEVIEEAKAAEADEDLQTINAVPSAMGVPAIGRFNRLELIDPVADAAVFGDANLTFAIKLVRQRKALGHAGRVIATTFEELETLRERYKEIDDSIATLEEHYAEVYHGVDCTKIAIDPRFKGMENCLGAVYYNFPHSGAIQGFFDGHPIVNWRHENLMRLFFRALRSFMKPGGVVKVASNMGAVGVRYSYIVGSAIENEFLHTETMPFLEWHIHRYGRSYGDKRDIYKRPDAVNNQSYNAQAADRDMVYCFTYAPSGEPLPPQNVRLPPSLKTLEGCVDGPFKHLTGVAKANMAKQMHQRFITEISGTHVG